MMVRIDKLKSGAIRLDYCIWCIEFAPHTAASIALGILQMVGANITPEMMQAMGFAGAYPPLPSNINDPPEKGRMN